MRFLFATWDGGGNVLPTIAIARELGGRGHSVRVLGPRSLRRPFEEAGCAFAAYVRVPNRAPSRAVPGVNGRARAALLALELARAAPTLAFAQDVLSELERDPVDVLVVDFMLAGAIAAGEHACIPTAALMHTLYCLPVPGRPPFGPGLEAHPGAAWRLRDAAVSALRRCARRQAFHDLNETRRTLGLTPLASASEQLERVARVLVLTTEAFDPPPACAPPNLCYVGPQLDYSSRPEPFDVPLSTKRRRPLVVVSFSSRHAATKVVQRVLDALAKLPVQGLVTLGPVLAPADLRLPANVVARPFVPHAAVLPRAQLVITHAGLGTVMAALAHGVPLLCIPLKNDQFENAARVVAAGAGRRLGSHARRSSLKRAILQLLNDPQFKDSAACMAEAIAKYSGRAVRELEAVSHLHKRPAERLRLAHERPGSGGMVSKVAR
jgi:MGT family glycosyltransferase